MREGCSNHPYNSNDVSRVFHGIITVSRMISFVMYVMFGRMEIKVCVTKPGQLLVLMDISKLWHFLKWICKQMPFTVA